MVPEEDPQYPFICLAILHLIFRIRLNTNAVPTVPFGPKRFGARICHMSRLSSPYVAWPKKLTVPSPYRSYWRSRLIGDYGNNCFGPNESTPVLMRWTVRASRTGHHASPSADCRSNSRVVPAEYRPKSCAALKACNGAVRLCVDCGFAWSDITRRARCFDASIYMRPRESLPSMSWPDASFRR